MSGGVVYIGSGWWGTHPQRRTTYIDYRCGYAYLQLPKLLKYIGHKIHVLFKSLSKTWWAQQLNNSNTWPFTSFGREGEYWEKFHWHLSINGYSKHPEDNNRTTLRLANNICTSLLVGLLWALILITFIFWCLLRAMMQGLTITSSFYLHNLVE